jgi:hydrogenase nickel incorporation protein HypA/HybF
MHELAIMAGMLDLIQEEAGSQGFARVRKVGMEVGRFSGVEAESLRFAFDVAVAGSVAEGAELEIVPVPGRARCRSCALEFPVGAYPAACPGCAGADLRMVGGKELRITYLDVD